MPATTSGSASRPASKDDSLSGNSLFPPAPR
jgi:hypothetical protein